MPETARFLAVLAVLVMLAQPSPAQQSTPSAAAPQSSAWGPIQQRASGPPSLEALLQQFDGRAAEPPGSVRLDAWVEAGAAGTKELVVAVVPEGEARLVADPGITVTPAARPGVAWQLPLPYRMVDTERDYFDPPAIVRLPFRSADDRPLQLLVEYAYCFVDFQCFLGEQELTVATAVP